MAVFKIDSCTVEKLKILRRYEKHPYMLSVVRTAKKKMHGQKSFWKHLIKNKSVCPSRFLSCNSKVFFYSLCSTESRSTKSNWRQLKKTNKQEYRIYIILENRHDYRRPWGTWRLYLDLCFAPQPIAVSCHHLLPDIPEACFSPGTVLGT